jgi:hemerythrin superfamily protein
METQTTQAAAQAAAKEQAAYNNQAAYDQGTIRDQAPGSQGNGLDLLLDDHKVILDLFSRYQKSTSKEEKLRLVDELVRTVSQHASAEERFLYPLVDKLLHARALYDRQVMDDQVNKEMLHWLETHKPALDSEWPLFDETLLKFHVVEEEHLRLEENTVMEPLRKALSPQEQAKLHDDLQWAKKFGPTHPHPGAPSTSPAANILHPVAGIVDKITDAIKHSGITEAVGIHRTTPGTTPSGQPAAAVTGEQPRSVGLGTGDQAAPGTAQGRVGGMVESVRGAVQAGIQQAPATIGQMGAAVKQSAGAAVTSIKGAVQSQPAPGVAGEQPRSVDLGSGDQAAAGTAQGRVGGMVESVRGAVQAGIQQAPATIGQMGAAVKQSAGAAVTSIKGAVQQMSGSGGGAANTGAAPSPANAAAPAPAGAAM